MRHKQPQVVLVVEDDAFIRFDITEHLRSRGWTVVEAECAQTAIEILSHATISLVFSDIQMPGSMDGIGLARWVKENRPEVPVILTSGGVRPGSVTDALCVEGPILKPYDLRYIHDRIRHHLYQARRA